MWIPKQPGGGVRTSRTPPRDFFVVREPSHVGRLDELDEFRHYVRELADDEAIGLEVSGSIDDDAISRLGGRHGRDVYVREPDEVS
jgi:hypothetical protein